MLSINDFKINPDRHTNMTITNHTLSDGVTLPLLSFPILENTGIVRHCFTTRLGGISEGIFSSLNLSSSRGDEKETVLTNYRRVAEALDTTIDRMVTSDQTHTTNVLKVGEKNCGAGITKDRSFTDVDGFITNEPGVVLATFYADCVPLYFVDPVKKAIGLAHSGWRGTVNKMGKVIVEAMTREYGSDPADIIATVGPSICVDCYEVSEDVAIEFEKAFPDNTADILFQKSEKKYQLNLQKANELIFLEAGITPNHIDIANLCTCCNPEILFSHRASQGKRGNLGAFMYLI